MSHSTHAVLTTGELLEAILLQLDIRTLLVSAPRVSRQWRCLVEHSAALQRALFFLPERPSRSISQDNAGDIQAKSQNPLLRDAFPAWFENTRAFTPRPQPGVNPVHAFPATAMMGYKRFQELPLYEAGQQAERGTSANDDDDNNPFLRPSASWRRMLTSQPPCHTLATSTRRGPGVKSPGADGAPQVARRDAGVRMGELYDAVLLHSMRHPVSGFMVIWPEGGDDGYLDLARHLRRMSGLLPLMSEVSLRLVWGRRPDVFVQMLWTDGSLRPGDVEDDDLEGFWRRCGSHMLMGKGEGMEEEEQERENPSEVGAQGLLT